MRLSRRLTVRFDRFYATLIHFVCRFRVAFCLLLVLAFGLPVFLLPEKMEETGRWSTFYNKIAMNTTYKETIRPALDKALGGSLRLFAKKVYDGSYFNREAGETVLSVKANWPNGCNIGTRYHLTGEVDSC